MCCYIRSLLGFSQIPVITSDNCSEESMLFFVMLGIKKLCTRVLCGIDFFHLIFGCQIILFNKMAWCSLLPKARSVLKVAHCLKNERRVLNVRFTSGPDIQTLECRNRRGQHKFYRAINSGNAAWDHGYVPAAPCHWSVFLNNRVYCFNESILLVIFFPPLHDRFLSEPKHLKHCSRPKILTVDKAV